MKPPQLGWKPNLFNVQMKRNISLSRTKSTGILKYTNFYSLDIYKKSGLPES